ncbi:TonB family C-terminal domain-containing protein [Ferrimonas sediminum]|uniref:TonB family C-terminal domain-containing protein n=1 Tax=Ferrimonas sediminum TaxID=718193 RepID=A0A1G8R783_9GAMM|nr:energy transducer TonB [Ferrimonas sediminum]SDJ12260.1 TonB family C-terminal domain-containing protein [Ferrimonas sediminum]
MKKCQWVSILLLCLSLGAFAGDEAGKAYQAYLTAVETGNPQQIAETARLAYELGSKEYGKDSINTATLALNLANQTRDHKAATRLLKPSLAVFKATYGNDAVELLDLYLALQQHSDGGNSSYYHNYARISERHYGKHSYNHGIMLMELANAMTRNTPRQGRDYAQQALGLIARQAQGNTVQRAEAEFLNGIYAQGFNDPEQAIAHYEKVVALFNVLDYSHPYALAAHSRLVPLLEKEGQSEAATTHCLAIGQMTPWREDVEATPLYRKEPRWPRSALKRRQEGSVILKLTIDDKGFVSGTDLVENRGSKLFIKETEKAVSQWRYAPRFEDGQAVTAVTTVKIDFKLH